ncbi:MAG: GntR family transcriptional regulator [Pseudodonghicola sp.]|jgi:DNA-binding GntR family transcriptional regulator|uniref:GntR family transcriptional regulator n=1 Tax=Pseudodonghicola sp. TaxID=1969463 RepID=UPI003A986953
MDKTRRDKDGGKGEATISSSTVIVRDIVRGLYEGRYVAGQRLVEPDLMQHYSVSRSTVREALKQLTSDGIVVSHPYRGASIRRMTRHDAENNFAIMEVVLGLAARQAAQHIDAPGAREKLQAHFDAIAAHEDLSDRFDFIRRRDRYFRALIEISGNPELATLLPRLQVHLIRNRLAVPVKERVEGYRKMTQAILSGDGAKAEKTARAYVLMTASHLLPHFPE